VKEDVVRAIGDVVLASSAEGQVFYVGTNNDVGINELAELVRRTLNSDSEIVHVPYSDVYGSYFEYTQFKLPDISKLQSCIDYHPIADLAFIVKEIADTPVSLTSPKAVG
jgi:UDP-glucose 4-epimerase